VSAKSPEVLTVFRLPRRLFGDKIMRRIIGPGGGVEELGVEKKCIANITIRVNI
jgi:hypothetical protein